MMESLRTYLTSRYPKNTLVEFLFFGLLQARACVFAGSFFVLLFASNHIQMGGLARYDLLFLGAIAIQIVLLATKIETWDEVKVIFLFHLIGFALELFKTQPGIGSWSYPEAGVLKISTVPLYSGFMYAAIGSYISQAWRLERLHLENYPPHRYSVALCVIIYLNFFTHHFIPDVRWILGAAVVWIFRSTRIQYTIIKKHWMPLPVAFALIAFFVWIAENISTYLGAWKYPDQIHEWTLVSFGKISSWSLLIIISFIIVANLKHLKEHQKQHHLPGPQRK
ncbi:MAG: hypothetical protein A2848_01695 [Candidatus Magasanikbacteria bacterium RIFCSPHIGHO2_01_FULL_50_8]|uniref:Uncharacterized protein n=1 Tax=Candidatus Magasanikbacteria bacterium RIFCSPHIGHO2_01_FULL_50_8 TaxID=1798674 RepID=A0A1F6LVF7_9BACT|nr:MAG: hypothetical protein A2848_01695 [Candidatus Magasanikbacteria bacterium RIFCSPHIGHO2_01_FULL_50_8]